MKSLAEYIKDSQAEEKFFGYFESQLNKMGFKTERNKELYIEDGRRRFIDLYLPEDKPLLNLHGPIYIEYKIRLLYSTFERTIRFASSVLKKEPKAHFLLLYVESDLILPKEYPIERFSVRNIDALLKDLDNKRDIPHNAVLDTQERPLLPKDNDPIYNDNLLETLKNELSGSCISFILGAGISIDAGSKSWNSLLKGVMKEYNHSPLNDKDFDSIDKSCGHSAIVTARYLMHSPTDKDKITQALKDNIYTLPPKTYLNGAKAEDTALGCIAKIVERHRNAVTSILTFNYDTFLEEALDNIKVPYMSFVRKGALSNDKLPIYHLHGIVGRNQAPSELPVLSEPEYHARYTDAFHWANVELLHALTRNTCVFVGLSMTDPNLRRLLDVAKIDDDNSTRHYVFLQKAPLKSMSYGRKNRKHWANMRQQFKELGLNIIWYDYNKDNPSDHSDLVTLLKKLWQ
jgi:hypothetical protein